MLTPTVSRSTRNATSWRLPTAGIEIQSCDSNAATTQTQFSAEKNPFLYPIELLDRALGRTIGTNAESSDCGENDVLNIPADGDWWLMHIKPRQEKKMADELRSVGIPHYLPATKCKALTRGRARVTWAPQFPGYLFLAGTAEQRLNALKTNRAVATHRVAESSVLCRQLWDLADLIEKEVPLRIEERLVAGQHVRVKAGLLRDKRGIVIKRGGKTRLFVFVAEMLGGVSVEIEQHLLEPY